MTGTGKVRPLCACVIERGINMPSIFQKIDRIKPAYDMTYQAVMFLCNRHTSGSGYPYHKYGGCRKIYSVYS